MPKPENRYGPVSAAGGESWLQICFVWLLRMIDVLLSIPVADCPAEVRGCIGRRSVTTWR
ncbi:hypothetical protein CCUG62472_04615 [Mycobacteroides salmoniphilum]|uniref:Uncharacterized protein n=1 Tax=Mycobacteroides salmoniphilum TaxID=404941 RepID=A0A4R8SQ91_9MYCO|nr:hypothetical protein CCUG62472_04615 [Mycobacteroides salmoniphilum]TEA01232.1 hypothetical protein CCUG60884_03981 [Mycobacteroides salmoniphilum]